MEDILIVQRFWFSRDESDCLPLAFMSIYVVSRCYWFGGIVVLGTRAIKKGYCRLLEYHG